MQHIRNCLLGFMLVTSLLTGCSSETPASETVPTEPSIPTATSAPTNTPIPATPLPTEVELPRPTPNIKGLIQLDVQSEQNGIVGNVYAPSELLNSVNPIQFKDGISFVLFDTADDTVENPTEGERVNRVEFTIFDSNGAVVHSQTEQTELFCAFGGNDPCDVWDFELNENKWSNGIKLTQEIYQATIEAIGDNEAKSSTWTFEFMVSTK